MSNLYTDEEIEIAKLTLNNQTSGTTTLYVANDYYPAKSIWGTKRSALFVRANSEYLSYADSAAVSTGNIDFCIAGWVNFTSVGTEQTIVGKWTSSQDEFLLFMTSTGRIRLNVTHDGSTVAYAEYTGGTSANTWYFVVAWHDATANTINVQVNDGTVNSTAHTLGVYDSTSALEFGRYNSGTSYLDARLDSWGYWKRVPSAAERTAFYNSGSGISYQDLSSANKTSIVAWWEFDAKSGDRYDSSGNGITLTDHNSVLYESGVGGNPSVWPLLADSPRVRRSFGPFAGNRHNVSIRLYGHVPYDANKTLVQAWKSDFYLNSGTLEIQYRPKPNELQHAETGEYTRQILEIVDASYNDNDGTILLEARDTWFKTKELSIPLNSSDFNDLDRRYESEPGATYFGNGGVLGKPGAVSPAPIIDSLLNNSTKEPNLSLFTGWTFDGHKIQTQGAGLPRFYGRNRNRQVDPRDWVPVEFPSNYTTPAYGTGPTYGGFYDPGTSAFLPVYSRAFLFQPPVYGHFVHAIGVYGLCYSQALSTGDFIISIYQAQLTSTNGTGGYTYAPVGNPIWQTQRNKEATTFVITQGETKFQVVPPLLCSPASPYFVTIEWSNTSDLTKGPSIFLKAQPGTFHYYRATNSGAGNATWVKQSDVALAASVYVLGRNGSHYLGSGTSRSASYYPVSGVDCRVFTNTSNIELAETIEVKIGADGIKDTSGGTYTGTASATIQNPADIIAFTLLDDDFGCAVDSSKLSATDWADARTRLASHPNSGLTDATVVIDSKMDAERLILDICRQSRLCFFKNKDGELVIHYPREITALSTAATLDQIELHDELTVLSFEDTPSDEIINDIECFYYPDVMNLVDDPDLNRKGGAAYREYVFCNELDTNCGSPTRSTRCANSQNLYGRRQFRVNLDIWNRNVRANDIVIYLVDRFSYPRQLVRVSVPRRDFYATADLTSKITLNHITLKNGTVNGEFLVTGDPYDASNIPQIVYDTGTLTGRVTDVQEFGPTMVLTLETDGPFGWPSY